MNDSIFWSQTPDQRFTSNNPTPDFYPTKAMISLTSRCNLHCWHCERHTDPKDRIDAPKEVLDYLCDRILPHCESLRIGGADIGEPLFAGNFNYFLKKLSKIPLKEVMLITNLTLLDEEKAKLICENIDFISVSLEGVGESYVKIRGFSWEEFIGKMELLDRCRKESSRKLRICLTVCAMRSNLDNLLELFNLKKNGVGMIVLREFNAWEKEKSKEHLGHDPEKVLKFIEKFEKRLKS